jgi:hypothetical protein
MIRITRAGGRILVACPHTHVIDHPEPLLRSWLICTALGRWILDEPLHGQRLVLDDNRH